MFATVVCSAAATGVVPKLPAKQIPRETKSKRIMHNAIDSRFVFVLFIIFSS